MRLKPILIGQAPGPKTDPELALFPLPKTGSGGRLMAVMGVNRATYMTKFERTNVLHLFPGQHKRDDAFPKKLARIAADAMRPLLAGRRVILVGRKVANAFGLEIPFHEWWELAARRRSIGEKAVDVATSYACVPHTSGRNPWYNSDENKLESLTFWDDLLERMKEQ